MTYGYLSGFRSFNDLDLVSVHSVYFLSCRDRVTSNPCYLHVSATAVLLITDATAKRNTRLGYTLLLIGKMKLASKSFACHLSLLSARKLAEILSWIADGV